MEASKLTYQPGTPHTFGFDFANHEARIRALEQSATPQNPAGPVLASTAFAGASGFAQIVPIALGIQILDAAGSSNVIAALQSGATNNITFYQQLESNALNPNSVNGNTRKHALRIPNYGASPGSLGFDLDNGVTFMWHNAAGTANAGKVFFNGVNDFYVQLMGGTSKFYVVLNTTGTLAQTLLAAFYPPAALFGYAFEIVGNGLAAGGSWYGTSDLNLKENIVEIDHALDKCLALTGVYFTWKDQQLFSPGRQVGFVAQEVQKILPEVVLEDRNGELALEYGRMVPVLLEAIKELTARVKVLESKVNV